MNKLILIFILITSPPLISSEATTPVSSLGKRKGNSITSQIAKKSKSETSVSSDADKFTIGIIGASGHVGSATAQALALRNVSSELLLWSRSHEQTKGLVLDCRGGLSGPSIIPVEHLQDMARSDIIIVAAGINYKKYLEQNPQAKEDRDERFSLNSTIVHSLLKQLYSSPHKNENATIVLVTNPVEDLSQYLLLKCKEYNYLREPEKQILNTGTSLDTDRLHAELKGLDLDNDDINDIYVLGEHGDEQFITWSHLKNSSLNHQISPTQKDQIAQKVKKMGFSIVKYRDYSMFGVARSLVSICVAIRDGGVLPVSVYHPTHKTYLSLLARLDRSGVQEIIDFPLDEQEQTKLQICIDKRRTVYKQFSTDTSESSASTS